MDTWVIGLIAVLVLCILFSSIYCIFSTPQKSEKELAEDAEYLILKEKELAEKARHFEQVEAAKIINQEHLERRAVAVEKNKQAKFNDILEETAETMLWIPVFSNDPNNLIDLGEIETNKLFAKSKILKRVCGECSIESKNIIYKRITEIPSGWSIYNNIKNVWASENNMLNIDFQMFGNMIDMKSNSNPWKFCNYDDYNNVGGFRDCGPMQATQGQWNGSRNDSRIVTYFVLS